MARYKLIFQDASWQDRKFISLTKINDDGSSQILHYVKGKSDDQISFGNYAAGHQNRKLEFSNEQTIWPGAMLGEKVASEDSFKRLLGEDILEQLYRDDDFLDLVEKEARSGNHDVIIDAAQDLKRGICAEMIVPVEYAWNFRKYVIKRYFEYLLSCKNLHVNADPDGMFTEIRCYFSASLRGAGVNDLNINAAAAASIRDQMETLLVDTYPPYPVIFQYLFVGQPVTNAGLGRFIEITDPSAEQIHIVDALFDMAAKNGFFPTEPREMILISWVANCEKISAKMAAVSSWGPGSPALLSAPARPFEQDHLHQSDIKTSGPGLNY